MKENNTEELERYNYIYHFGSKIIKKWINVSELRFGQLMANFETWLKIDKNLDIFYIEDEDFFTYFNEFTKEMRKTHVKWEDRKNKTASKDS